ncbi:MAG: nucleotidyltransferase family protein [Clostridia bacterium]|nr:nucleotidyltransferase family protein [Clostridia bacterium]
MKIAVIIAEFNPFHKGHEYLIQQTRELTDCTHIVVIQTGNFTQRGEPAIIEKHLRAESAIMCGIDAVLEMPTAFATSNPEVYAKAGVQIANTIPHASYLVFGVEDNNLALLKQIAYVKIKQSHEYEKYLKVHLKAGLSLVTAEGEVIKKLLPKIPPMVITKILNGPNNILAIEYLRELYRLHSGIQPISVARHKDKNSQTNTSALAIRDAYYANNLSVEDCIPAQVLPFFMESIEKHPIKDMFESTILFNTLNELDVKNTFDVTADIAQMLRTHRPITYQQLTTTSPKAHYSAKHVKRVALHATLGVTQKDINFIYQHNHLPYTNLLAIRSDAHDLFNELTSIRQTPVIVHGNRNKPSKSKYYARMRQIDYRAHSLYEIACRQKFPQRPHYVVFDQATEPIIHDEPINVPEVDETPETTTPEQEA